RVHRRVHRRGDLVRHAARAAGGRGARLPHLREGAAGRLRGAAARRAAVEAQRRDAGPHVRPGRPGRRHLLGAVPEGRLRREGGAHLRARAGRHGGVRRPVVDGEPEAAAGRDGGEPHRGARLDGPPPPATAPGGTPPEGEAIMTTHEIRLHGHRIGYRTAGDGPVLLLIHGIAGSSATWDEVLPWLAERYCVLAPDLLGHGASAKPRGDYSLGAYASGIRDLLGVLGHERASVVGHSLGGGVAMQLAYQFPERCERLALVSSGGLGREVHAILRAAALPGSEWVLPLLCTAGLRDAVDAVARTLGKVGLRAGADLDEMWRAFCSLGDADARQAFVHTLRTIIDPGGQRVHAGDRLYLASEVPTLIVWGEHDP